MILNGTEKSALLLMSIGSDQAGEILKNLAPFEIKELINTMLNINTISTAKLNQILSECYDLAVQNNSFHHNDEGYLITMLKKALGDKEGSACLKGALEVRNAKVYIESLNYIKPEKLAYLLNNEHIQIIVIILIYLNKNQSAKVLSFFNEKKRAEIILRITEFNGIEESSLIELTQVIENIVKNKQLVLSEKGGLKSAVRILNSMKIKKEHETIKNISLLNKQLADAIINEIFLFKNIVDLDDKYIKYAIQHIEQEKLYIALQKTNYFIREKFFRNMSKLESNQLSLSLERKSYASDASIKNEQKLILMMIRSIIDNGDVSLKNLREYYV